MEHQENDLNRELIIEVEKTYTFPNTMVFNLAKEKEGNRVIVTHELKEGEDELGNMTKPDCFPHMNFTTLGVKRLESAEEYVTEYNKLNNIWLLLDEIKQ